MDSNTHVLMHTLKNNHTTPDHKAVAVNDIVFISIMCVPFYEHTVCLRLCPNRVKPIPPCLALIGVHDSQNLLVWCQVYTSEAIIIKIRIIDMMKSLFCWLNFIIYWRQSGLEVKHLTKFYSRDQRFELHSGQCFNRQDYLSR